jgi:two-component system, OmpR family, response regulator
MKILLVEDDAETADYVARGLTEAGHLVDRAADGREGLLLASDGAYDALVVDRMLPKLDGRCCRSSASGSALRGTTARGSA